MNNAVNIECRGAGTLPLSDILDFQGELKVLSDSAYKKLKKQILENGFSFPFAVWENDGKYYTIDGHQRKKTLLKMQGEGIEIPDEFPVDFIHAKDEKQAKKKLLSAVAQYGKMTEESLFNFAEEAGFEFGELEEFEFVGLDMEGLKGIFEEDKTEEKKENDLRSSAEKNEIIVENKEEYLLQFDKYIIMFSGGKDSTLLLLWAIEHMPKEKILAVYWDSSLNWEDEEKIFKYFCKKYSIEGWIFGYKNKNHIEDIIKQKGYPFYGNLWCQSLLKIKSTNDIKQEMIKNGKTFIYLSGIRKSESEKRSNYPEFYETNKTVMYCPLLEYTDNDLIKYLKEKNEKLIPVYKYANRTGCYFCPNSDIYVRGYLKHKHPDKLCYVNELLYMGMKNELWKGKKFDDLFIFFNQQRDLKEGNFKEIAYSEEEFEAILEYVKDYKEITDLRA